MNLSSSGVGLIRGNLADSKESCGFLRDLLIRRNLADYVSSADSMSSSRGTDDDCRLFAGYISDGMFESIPGFSRRRARYLE